MQISQPLTSYISNLTPLRGITALLVAVYHFEDLMVRFVPQATSLFFSKCYLMVDIFFIMSGFIITHVYQVKFEGQTSFGTFKKYLVARFARVYPLHLLMLLVILISFVAAGSPVSPIQDPNAIPSNLLLIHSFGLHNSFTWNVPSWSISAEWWCYMLFPLIIGFVNRKRSIAIPVLILLAATAYFSMVYLLPRVDPTGAVVQNAARDLNVTFDYGALRGLAGFVVGMVLYKAYELPRTRVVFASDWPFFLFSVAAIGCLHFGVQDLLLIPLFAGLVISAACNSGAVHKLFERPFLQMLGDVSYSIYMLHVVLIFAVIELISAIGFAVPSSPSNNVPFWIGLSACLAFLALVVFLSILSYQKIERPCRDYINGVARTPSASAS